MIRWCFIWIFIGSTLSCTSAKDASPHSDKSLMEAEGQTIEVALERSMGREQHPHPPEAVSGPALNVTYARLANQPDGAELVVLSQEPITCDRFKVTATVEIQRQGGTVGKETYVRPWLHVSQSHCD